MLREFKKFATKGNIMDLAIGVIIGGAFQKIVNSLVGDIIMPCISIVTGRIDFSDMAIKIGDASISYGNFITSIVDFLVIAFSLFLVIRYLNKLNSIKDLGGEVAGKLEKRELFKKIKENKKKKEEPEPETKICNYCLSEIKYKAIKCPSCTSDLKAEEKNI